MSKAQVAIQALTVLSVAILTSASPAHACGEDGQLCGPGESQTQFPRYVHCFAVVPETASCKEGKIRLTLGRIAAGDFSLERYSQSKITGLNCPYFIYQGKFNSENGILIANRGTTIIPNFGGLPFPTPREVGQFELVSPARLNLTTLDGQVLSMTCD